MRRFASLVFFTIVLIASSPLGAQVPQDTAFTYQGELRQNEQPVTGDVDMVFTLHDAASGGNPVGAPIVFTAANNDAVPVVDGIFTVTLDFGAAAFITMVDDARWLEVSVDGNTLSPRTKIENAPYALTAQLAYGVLAGSIGTAQINAAQVQRRVTGTCAAGSSISVINQDGTVSCQNAGSGTISGVTPVAGSGITGGGSSGNVSLGSDTGILQSRVTGTCPSGSAISVVARDGTVTCQAAGITLPYTATQSNAGPLVNVTNTDTGGASTALQGTSNSTAANVSAVEGVISSTTPGNFSAGVRGISNSTTGNGVGVYGTTAGSGPGVNGTSALGIGVFGNGSAGVEGNATAPQGTGVTGLGYQGVLGQSSTKRGFGVVGFSEETTTSDPPAFPIAAYGPIGVYGQASAPSGVGVYGIATDQTGGTSGAPWNVGVYGEADGPFGIGIVSYTPASLTTAILANAPGDLAIGVYAEADQGTALVARGANAAFFFGPVGISGSLASGPIAINAAAPTSDIELEVSSINPNNPSADILLQPYGANFGFDFSVGGTSTSNLSFCICQTPDGLSYTQFLGLDASGNLAIHGGTATKPGGGSWSAPSDVRLKRDIRPLEHMLDKLLQLRGVSFEYKQPDTGLHPAGRHTGFIAQEVQEVFPDWVGQTTDGYLSVGPQGFEAMTVEALRELRAEKDAEIDGLHTQLDELNARLNRLEQAQEAQQ